MPGYRRHQDRAALVVGARVQLSWFNYVPYPQHADLSVRDRLGVVTSREADSWTVVDDLDESHQIDDTTLEVTTTDPAQGRWRIEGAIPAYRRDERLLLALRFRNGEAADPPREAWATVIDEQPDRVRVRLDDGAEVLLFRWGAQADEPDRKAPRWFVQKRG